MTPGDRILTVIPSYHPSADIIDLVRALVAADSDVLVVDDGSGLSSEPVLTSLEQLGASVIRHQENKGIAAALNTALEEGSVRGAQWLYTLDQDSVPHENFSEDAIAYSHHCRSRGLKVGVLSPAANNGVRIAGRDRGGILHPYDPIQSGSLLAIAAAQAVGGFEASYVIDGVDSEMTAKLRQAGFAVVCVPDTNLRHALGHRVPATLAGIAISRRGSRVTVNQHSPFRVYYMTRNGIDLTRKYFRSSPLWVSRRLFIEVSAHAMRVVLGRDRRLQVTAIAWGLRDGLRSRSGVLDSRRQEILRPTALHEH